MGHDGHLLGSFSIGRWRVVVQVDCNANKSNGDECANGERITEEKKCEEGGDEHLRTVRELLQQHIEVAEEDGCRTKNYMRKGDGDKYRERPYSKSQ